MQPDWNTKIRVAVKSIVIAAFWSICITAALWLYGITLPSNPVLSGFALLLCVVVIRISVSYIIEGLYLTEQQRQINNAIWHEGGRALARKSLSPLSGARNFSVRVLHKLQNSNAIADGLPPPHSIPQNALAPPAPTVFKTAIHSSVPQHNIEQCYRTLGYADSTRLGDTIEAHDVAFAKALKLYADPDLMKRGLIRSNVQRAWETVCADNRWPSSVLDDKKVSDAVYQRLIVRSVPIPTPMPEKQPVSR